MKLKVNIGCRYEETRVRVKDIVSRAILKGALEMNEAFVEVDGLHVIITDMEEGEICYFCKDMHKSLRFQAEILNPKTKASEKYSIHCYHFIDLGRNN